MDQNINSSRLLVDGEKDIKNYHILIEYFVIIGTESLQYEDEEGSAAGQKWRQISDLFKLMGFSPKKFTPIKCRTLFYKWSSFYAKNYDKLNGKLEHYLQKTYDFLKIVHILDFNKFWIFDNSTHILLREISTKPEVKEYVNRKLKNLETNEKKQREVKTKWETIHINCERIVSFEDMNLKEDLLRGLLELGYTKPSSIQQQTIIAIINGGDVMAQSQSGTGKTAAFAIAILQRIDRLIDGCQALILVPTRELAQQIHKEVSDLAKYMSVRCHLSIGGTDIRIEVNQLKRMPHIVIGTSGRILDIMKKKVLTTEAIKILVFDECDQLLRCKPIKFSKKLSKAFDKQIFEIYDRLNPCPQVIFSSATIPRKIIKMSQLITTSPLKILVNEEELTLEGLQQYYVNAGEGEGFKFNIFLELYQNITKAKGFESSTSQVFVYCNSITTVDVLVQMLANIQINVAYMHGKTIHEKRQKTLEDFRNGSSRVLITTDLLGRGIDVKEVEFVINYDLPQNRETYMHRVGRSGRFGRTGKAITLITNDQMGSLQNMESFYHTHITQLPDDISVYFDSHSLNNNN